jgi:hypothetical protein
MLNIDAYQNHVKVAIDRVGGPTKAANLMEVSNGCIHVWMTNRRVPNIDKARKLSSLSGMAVELLRRTK